ncbi:hypothetical protein DMENIID0001_130020 [Sergentomyia squamirostris]
MEEKYQRILKYCDKEWTEPMWVEFYENCKEAITTFDILVPPVHDIDANRIIHVVMSAGCYSAGTYQKASQQLKEMLGVDCGE